MGVAGKLYHARWAGRSRPVPNTGATTVPISSTHQWTAHSPEPADSYCVACGISIEDREADDLCAALEPPLDDQQPGARRG